MIPDDAHRPPRPRVAWGRTLVMSGVVGASSLVLIGADTGTTSVPLASVQELADWLDTTAPPDIAMAVVRLAALAACAYLAVALAVTVIAGLAPRRHVLAGLARLAPYALRRAVLYGAGSSLVTGVTFGWLAPHAPPAAHAQPAVAQPPPDDPTPHTATMTKLDPASPGPPPDASVTRLDPAAQPPTTSRSAAPDTARTTVAPSPSPPPTDPDPTTAEPAAPTSTAPPGGSHAQPGADEWIVAPGESFWTIAEEALRDARGGTQPSDDEIARYWRQLIAANRPRLSAPDNPDLLHTGQPLHLPPPT